MKNNTQEEFSVQKEMPMFVGGGLTFSSGATLYCIDGDGMLKQAVLVCGQCLQWVDCEHPLDAEHQSIYDEIVSALDREG